MDQKETVKTVKAPTMKRISIFNHVLGPVMRGPSSSHTAGAYHIAVMARGLGGDEIKRVTIAFDPKGSYIRTYAQQGADRAFAMGFMGKPLTDESFFTALQDAPAAGLDLQFVKRPLQRPDHPNAMEIEIGRTRQPDLLIEARSIGGGDVEITRLDGFSVALNGSAWEVILEAGADTVPLLHDLLNADGALLGEPAAASAGEDRIAIVARRARALSAEMRKNIRSMVPESILFQAPPVYLVQTGLPLFTGAEEMIRLADSKGGSLGEASLAYECALLGLTREEALAEMLRRYDIMAAAAVRGLAPDFTGMQILKPSAGKVFQAEAAGRLSLGGPLVRAAARSMAVMHTNGAMGVVCAAPTGGSAGTIPGTVITLAEEKTLSREKTALALFAAGGVGLITAYRATFAAEVAGCQVEIGAAGAMAAAAVVDACGGTARQACDAAAIGYQNTMGSVCDLVLGMVEIPCHTRNAAASASAFVLADLILGGYANPISLDETIDAVYSVGRMLPSELRCTSKGGIAVAPSALALKPAKKKGPAK
jgi:L-serine dehydratase